MRIPIMRAAACIAVTTLLAVLSGCGKSDGPGKSTVNLASMKRSNLSGAKAVFRTGGAVTKADDGIVGVPILYKVGLNDQATAVIFTDDQGETIPAVTDRVIDLSDKYAAMCVCASEKEREYGPFFYFVIRKSDGKLFTTDLSMDNFREALSYLFPEGMHVSDQQGNVYFRAGTGLCKIHESGGQTTFTPFITTSLGQYWYMNGNGDVVTYPYWYKADGTVIPAHETLVDGQSAPFALDGIPGSFFQIEYTGTPTVPAWSLAQYTAGASEVTRTVVHAFAYSTSASVITAAGRGVTTAWTVTPEQSYACVISGSASGVEVDYYPIPTECPMAKISQIGSDAAVSKDYLYAYDSDGSKISRFNPQTGEHIENYCVLSGYVWAHVLKACKDETLLVVASKAGKELLVEIGTDRQPVELSLYYNGMPITLYQRLD